MITYKDLPVKKGETVKLTITMDVTAPQAYALMEMFKYWNFCGQAGISRKVAFLVDGDGDFHPNCEFKTEPKLPAMPKEQSQKAEFEYLSGNIYFDFDPIGWSLND